ncbi:MAG: hypothetical protein EXR64_00990 [Dehalococcoidia bacterium]|nr:hypothetical protein [Dehalococcoidia bacterium]
MDSLLVAWEPPADHAPGQRTFEVVRDALLASPALAARNVRVYLQGAHASDTLIRADEPVDVVIESGTAYLTGYTPHVSDLTRQSIEGDGTAGSWDYWQFRGEVQAALQAAFPGAVRDGRHALRVMHTSLSVTAPGPPAEVIAALPYRHYSGLGGWTAGITYFTRGFEQVVHYPRLHRDNGALKDRETEGRYRATVRTARQMRDYLQDVLALERGRVPSYFLECLLWNVPARTYAAEAPGPRMQQVVRYLEGAYLPAFEQQHMIESLFGPTPSQWTTSDARLFIDAASRWLGAEG